MRTTISIEDGLLRTAKHRAAEERRTLGDLIEVALRHYLAMPMPDPSAGPPLPVFEGGGGVRPGVDLSTNAGLYEVMYAEENEKMREMIRGARP